MTVSQLHQAIYPANVQKFTTTVPKTDFTNFEIDLEPYASSGIEYDYAVIQLIMKSEYNLSSTVSTAVIDDLHFEYEPSLDVEENDFLKNINVYPNPAKDIVNINLPKEYSKVNTQLYNILGKRILSKDYYDRDIIKMNISNQSKGIYFIHVKYNNVFLTRKIIKK